jgi:lysophospholipase L1-like esterase
VNSAARSPRRIAAAFVVAALGLGATACEVPDPTRVQTLAGREPVAVERLKDDTYGDEARVVQRFGPRTGAVGMMLQVTSSVTHGETPSVHPVAAAMSDRWQIAVVSVRPGSNGLADVRAAASWARARVGRRPIVMFGHEFSAPFVIRQTLDERSDVDAAILVRPVTGRSRLSEAYRRTWRAVVDRDPDTEQLLSVRSLPHVSARPVYIAHGDRDNDILLEGTLDLYERWRMAGDERAWLDTVEGIDADPSQRLNIAAIDEFLKQVVGRTFPPAVGDAPAYGATRVFTLGDSLTVGAIDAGFRSRLAEAGFIGRDNARVGRPLTTGIAILRDEIATGRLEPVVIVALGTNDLFRTSDWFASAVDEVMRVVGNRHVIWVNMQVRTDLRRNAMAGHFNAVLAAKALKYPNLTIGDWATDGPADALYGDGFHYNPRGYAARAAKYVDYLRVATGRPTGSIRR